VAFFGEPAYRARELRAFKNLLTKHDHIRSRMATEIKKKNMSKTYTNGYFCGVAKQQHKVR